MKKECGVKNELMKQKHTGNPFQIVYIRSQQLKTT